MGLCDHVDDRQPEAGAGNRGVQLVAPPLESFPDGLLILRWNPRTIVVNLDDQRTLATMKMELAPVGAVANCILEQIHRQLADAVDIDPDREVGIDAGVDTAGILAERVEDRRE